MLFRSAKIEPKTVVLGKTKSSLLEGPQLVNNGDSPFIPEDNSKEVVNEKWLQDTGRSHSTISGVVSDPTTTSNKNKSGKEVNKLADFNHDERKQCSSQPKS